MFGLLKPTATPQEHSSICHNTLLQVFRHMLGVEDISDMNIKKLRTTHGFA